MRIIAVVMLCVAGIFLIGGCATGPQAKKRPATIEELFRRADANGDGRVSRDEFINFLIEDAFQRYDRNGDGYVDLEGYIAGGGTESDFRKINRSGTGKVTLQEAQASPLIRNRMAKPFDEADKNGNGYITWDEFQEYMERARPYTRT